jgi:hypothetical protein
MTLNQDEAIARTCGCGEFDDDAAEHWDDLTCEERWEIGKRQAAREASTATVWAWTPGEIAEADYVPF